MTDLQGGSNGDGNVAIFKNAGGNPTYYKLSRFAEYFFCGYDNEGNLFVDGLSRGAGDFVLAELPKSGDTLTKVDLNQYIGFPGGVQWDGKHLAVGDQTTNVYQFSIAGSQATLVGKTRLAGATYVKQFWIQNQTLIAPEFSHRHRRGCTILQVLCWRGSDQDDSERGSWPAGRGGQPRFKITARRSAPCL